MKRIIIYFILICLILSSLLVGGCASRTSLVIISGSENKSLEPIIEEFERKQNIDVQLVYKGSVDMMMMMKDGSISNYDAVWPANSLWISLGDNEKRIKHTESIMTSPVVFGVRKSLAEKLNLMRNDVKVKDILQLIREKKLSFMMTSATQSNSGASSYLGFITALSEKRDTLTIEDLESQQLQTEITELLSGINRSSGSSGWLKELFLEGENYDAMVNYEVMIIETNQELIRQGKEPLYAVYPVDGLAVADSPLGYVNNNNKEKEEAFLKLQEYLLSEDIQKKILDLGRRTEFGGLAKNADKDIFNPDWGIDGTKTISGMRMPQPDVIEEALFLYQTQFKKPSLTVYCLDFSGSMRGSGEKSLKESMNLILNQKEAEKYYLQSTSKDITIVIPFSDKIFDIHRVEGNDEQVLNNLINAINNYHPDGGTDIYQAAMYGLNAILENPDYNNYISAVILMTDGMSNGYYTHVDLKTTYEDLGVDIPVFSIMFGRADENQLEDIAHLTRARVFNGKENLIEAFKKARGYN